jgi:transposase
VAAHFKKAAEYAAKIILIDETGILMRPLVRRSLAPRGNPMVVRYQSKHRQKVSVQGALVLNSEGEPEALRCQMHEDSYVDGQKTAQFLRKLLAEFQGPVIVVWDRGNMHRGPFIREVLEQFPRLSLEQLPAYCPDLNPIEWFWSWIKYCELANFCPRDLRHLTSELAKTLLQGAENTSLQENFVRAAGLATTAEPDRSIAA